MSTEQQPPTGPGGAGANVGGAGPNLNGAGPHLNGAGPHLGGAGPSLGGGGFLGLGTGQRRSSTGLIRIVVGVLGLLLLIGSAAHLVPAVRAALHDGTRGYWVATARTCSRDACSWKGKFALPSGHVQLASAQYSGGLPTGIHAGTRIPALFTGSGLVFPVTGSDLWISLVVGIVVGLLGLYWASHKWVAGYLRQRDSAPTLAPPLR